MYNVIATYTVVKEFTNDRNGKSVIWTESYPDKRTAMVACIERQLKDVDIDITGEYTYLIQRKRNV